MTSPLVSVIVPMFQSAATVGRTIASIRAQSMRDWEAIVVDDGSTDNGSAVVRETGAGDERMRIVRQENRGLAGARNTGINQARGAYLHFLDADDWLAPDGLKALVECVKTSGLPAACARLELSNERGESLGLSSEHQAASVGFAELLDACCFPVHAQIVSREAVGSMRFDEGLEFVEDWDFWLRLAERGVQWATSGACVGGYRLRSASMSRRSARMFRCASQVIGCAFTRARADGWASRGVDLSEERLEVMRDHLAIEAATTSALDDPTPRKDAGAAILASRKLSGPVDPFHAAARACARLPYADCRGPGAWESEMERYTRALASLWERCVAERWAPSGFVEQARRRLAAALISPEMVADDLASQATRARPTVLLGLGRNGRRTARALAKRGLPFTGFDDALDAQPRWAPDDGLRFAVHRELSEAPHEALCLITPAEDSELVARALDLPGRVAMRRWRVAADALADDMHVRLVDAWPTVRPGAMLHARVG
jgi:hypothetical protein